MYKFGMDDRLDDAKEAAENVTMEEEALAKIDLQIANVLASVILPDSLSILYCCEPWLVKLQL